MIESIISIILPIYGIFMFIVREDRQDLLQYSLASILCYLFLFVELELGLAGFVVLLLKTITDYVVN